MSPRPAGPVRIDIDPAATEPDFGADYGDAFRIPAPPPASARQWAERALRGAEVGRGTFRRLVWGGLLAFDMAPDGTPGTAFGWTITQDDPERFVVQVDGRRMAGRMTFVIADGALTWTTLLRFHRAGGRRVWSTLGRVHRALVPRCLDGAAASLRRHPAPAT